MNKVFSISSEGQALLQRLRAELHEEHRRLGQLVADFEAQRSVRLQRIEQLQAEMANATKTLAALFCKEPGDYELTPDAGQFKERT